MEKGPHIGASRQFVSIDPGIGHAPYSLEVDGESIRGALGERAERASVNFLSGEIGVGKRGRRKLLGRMRYNQGTDLYTIEIYPDAHWNTYRERVHDAERFLDLVDRGRRRIQEGTTSPVVDKLIGGTVALYGRIESLTNNYGVQSPERFARYLRSVDKERGLEFSERLLAVSLNTTIKDTIHHEIKHAFHLGKDFSTMELIKYLSQLSLMTLIAASLWAINLTPLGNMMPNIVYAGVALASLITPWLISSKVASTFEESITARYGRKQAKNRKASQFATMTPKKS